MLTPAQRRRLKALANPAPTLLTVGASGVTAGTLDAIRHALASHPVVKVRVSGERARVNQVGDELAAALPCELVDRVGKVVILASGPAPDGDEPPPDDDANTWGHE